MSDALLTAAAATREALGLALDGLGMPAGPEAPPRGAGDLTPQWLGGVLQSTFPGVQVVSLERVGGHDGTTDRTRIAIEYADPGRGDEPPDRLFVKAAPKRFTMRLFGNLMRLGEGEARAYREILPDAGVEAPRCYYVGLGRRAQRFLLLLEDLEQRGARFTTIARSPSVADVHAVMRELARLHAAFWQSPRLSGDLSWLKTLGRNPARPVERFVTGLGLPRGLERFPELIPEPLRGAGARLVAMLEPYEAALASGPQTVIHGDDHIGNMYFVGERAGLLDWQCARQGPGLRDVAYFFSNSLPVELRRAHERSFVEVYLDALREAGVGDAPRFDDAFEQMQLHVFGCVIAALVTAAGTNFQAGDVVSAGIERACTAAADHGTLERVERFHRES